MFYVMMPSLASRQALISHLAGLGFWLFFIICRYICHPWVCGSAGAKATVPSPKIYPDAFCVFRFSPE
jgi:hypothetical protein